jgi:hypothetical protein
MPLVSLIEERAVLNLTSRHQEIDDRSRVPYCLGIFTADCRLKSLAQLLAPRERPPPVAGSLDHSPNTSQYSDWMFPDQSYKLVEDKVVRFDCGVEAEHALELCETPVSIERLRGKPPAECFKLEILAGQVCIEAGGAVLSEQGGSRLDHRLEIAVVAHHSANVAHRILTRRLARFLAELQPAKVALEACGSAYHRAVRCRALAKRSIFCRRGR